MFLTLARHSTARTRCIYDTLSTSGIVNVFNPSVLKCGNVTSVAFRGLTPGIGKPFRAFFTAVDAERKIAKPQVWDLTAAFMPFTGFPVADPKLFAFDGRVWITFNTGHFEKPNSIYVAPLSPQIGRPLRVELPQRQKIEKNWGFYEDAGQLCALYSLDPLVILTSQSRDADAITMQAQVEQLPRLNSKRPTLTIGTQPVRLAGPDGPLALMAHRRCYFRRKRLYTGRPVLVDPASGAVGVGASPWFHSLRALGGDRVRHNPNLLSCTYFSGLTLDGANLIVSYGINDVNFAFAEMPQDVWVNLLR